MRRTTLLLVAVLLGACVALTGCQSAEFSPEPEVSALSDRHGGSRGLVTGGPAADGGSALLASSSSAAWWADRNDDVGLVGTAPSLGEPTTRQRTITLTIDRIDSVGGQTRDRFRQRRFTRTETVTGPTR